MDLTKHGLPPHPTTTFILQISAQTELQTLRGGLSNTG